MTPSAILINHVVCLMKMYLNDFNTLRLNDPYRADSRFAPSQWETALLCNDVSHWLGASLESALSIYKHWRDESLLVPVMASCLFGAKPLLQSKLTNGQLEPQEQTLKKFNHGYHVKCCSQSWLSIWMAWHHLVSTGTAAGTVMIKCGFHLCIWHHLKG